MSIVLRMLAESATRQELADLLVKQNDSLAAANRALHREIEALKLLRDQLKRDLAAAQGEVAKELERATHYRDQWQKAHAELAALREKNAQLHRALNVFVPADALKTTAEELNETSP